MGQKMKCAGLVVLLWALLGFNLIILGCVTTETMPVEIVKEAVPENALKVGVSPTAPPIIFKQNGRVTGLEAEFARELGKFIGKAVSFVEVEWEDQIPALLEGRTDIIMSGMSITTLRKVRIAFSNPYFRTGQMALIRNEDRTRFANGYYSVVLAKSIGTVKGTTGDFFVERHMTKGKKVSFPTAAKGVEALINKEIDVFIHDAPIILMLASENESQGLTPLYSLLTEEYLAWGVRSDDTELLEWANRFIETIKNDGRLDAMIRRWIPLAE